MDKKRILKIVVGVCLFFIVAAMTFFLKFGYIYEKELDGSYPVQIVYITDDNYVDYMRTSIRSVIANKYPYTKIEIYVIGHDLNPQNIKRIESEKKKNVSIKIIPTQNEYISGFEAGSKNTPGVSRADNYKFFLPTLLNDLEKVIYLDGDTIVLKDLSDFYMTQLADNYVAVTDDWQTGWFDNSNKRYFNNGVMLLNLEQMRKDNVESKLADFKRNDKIKRFVTQDAFNVVMKDKVVFVPLIYDTFAPEYDSEFLVLWRIKETLKDHFNKHLYPYKTGKDYLKNVAIIHYCGYGNKKPWNEFNLRRKSSRLWYKYAPLDYWFNNKKQITNTINNYFSEKYFMLQW